MKKNIYFLAISCTFFLISSCETTSYIQSNQLATYTASSTVKAHQKIMLVMYGNADLEKFYNKTGANFKNMVEKEHDISVVYKILTPLSFETQADIDQAIKAQKADFVIEIQQEQSQITPVTIAVSRTVATTTYAQEVNFILTLKNVEVKQVFWKAATIIGRSASGFVLSNRLFSQLKKDGIITGGQLGMK